MIKKGSMLCVLFVSMLGALELKTGTDLKAAVLHNYKNHIIKQYPLPVRGCVHITAQEAPVYIDMTSKQIVTISVRICDEQQKIKRTLHKGKMINDDILHIVTKEQDYVHSYYISVPESAHITVVSKGNIHATIPHAHIEAKGRTIHAALASSSVAQVDETNRCYIRALISNGKHFEFCPTIELDTPGDITIQVARDAGLGYGSYLLTQLIGKIKESWQELQEFVTE